MPPTSDGETRIHQPNGDTAMILYRLNEIDKKLDAMTSDHEERLRGLEDTTARLSERMTLWQFGQAGLTVIAATIAAMIGRAP